MMRVLKAFICLCLLNSVICLADTEKEKAVSPWLYKKLSNTESLIAKKSYQQAVKQLQAILLEVDSGSYEQATVLKSLSSAYALSGNYAKAAQALAKSLSLKVLSNSQEQQATLSLGQLYMALEQYSKAIQTLEPWLVNNSTSDVQINVLVANAYAQLKQYRKALPYIKKAIAKSKKPEDSWYQLNLAIYYELSDYNAAATVLKKLIIRYPEKKTYWNQLSSVYQQQQKFNEATSIKYLAYKKGFITSEKELLELANLYLYIKSPYKAAKLIEDGFQGKQISKNSKNWEMLANAWTAAKEFDKSVIALEAASKLNPKGGLYQQLGQIYVQQEKWNEAISAFSKALNKGGLKNSGDTLLMQGMSYYELNNIEQAKKVFQKAKQYNQSKKSAIQWLKYIENS